MLKKTITYQDVDGNPVTEDFYFNVSTAELAEMELRQKGGMKAHLERIAAAEDGDQIMDTIKKIILDAVGQRSEDGRRFIKSQEISDDFKNSDAYSVLFMELVMDANAAVAFMSAIVPKDLASKMDRGETITDLKIPDEEPEWLKTGREPTKEELVAATPEQLREAFRRKNAAPSE